MTLSTFYNTIKSQGNVLNEAKLNNWKIKNDISNKSSILINQKGGRK